MTLLEMSLYLWSRGQIPRVLHSDSLEQCCSERQPENFFVVSKWSLFSIRISLPVSPILFRLLRIGKLTRAIRMVTMHSVLQSLHLLLALSFSF